MKSQLSPHLQRLLDLFDMQMEPKASDLSPQDVERLAEFLGEKTSDPWEHEAALDFLAISGSEPAAQAIQSTLESGDVRLTAAALRVVGERWPDTRFRPGIERYACDVAASSGLRIPAALALYRMGERDGFRILAAYAVGDATETHESEKRLRACGALAQFTRAEDLEALVPLIGAGAYMWVAFRLIKEKGEGLIPSLRQEFSRARQKDYVAFTLCQLGDREGFEHTKRVLLNFDKTVKCDYPIIWAIDALIGLYLGLPRRWSSEELCPFFRELLTQQMQRPLGGDCNLIGRALTELQRYECRGDSTHEILTQLQAHIERDVPWEDKEKARLTKQLAHYRTWLSGPNR